LSFAELLNALLESFYNRNISQLKRLLVEHQSALEAMNPHIIEAPLIFFVLACCLEYRPALLACVKRINQEYSAQPWRDLRLPEWAWIEIGRARLAYYENRDQDVDAAIQWIYDNAPRFGPSNDLLAAADLTKAQSLKRRARYGEALQFARRAVIGYASLPRMAAVANITLGWLLLQTGNVAEAAQVWAESERLLADADDPANRANIIFYKARRLARANLERESEIAHETAAGYYLTCDPRPRNLRRVLLSLSDLQYRMAGKRPHSATALRDAAAKNIAFAEKLLADDPTDIRNHGRLLLAKVNRALYGDARSCSAARREAKAAFDFAKNHQDQLIMARARLRQATVEQLSGASQDRPERILARAAHYAQEALEYATALENDRLTARCHKFLGTLYLNEPFSDVAAARSHYEAAVQCMARHEDLDYLVEDIRGLGKQLESSRLSPQRGLIIALRQEECMNRRLEATLQCIERAIIVEALRAFGDTDRALCEVLETGVQRIHKHLAASARESKVLDPTAGCGPEIVTITRAIAFSQRLEETIRGAERAIIRAAWRQHHGDLHAVLKTLQIGFDRLKPYLIELHESDPITTR
jgi:hypothetical protein